MKGKMATPLSGEPAIVFATHAAPPAAWRNRAQAKIIQV